MKYELTNMRIKISDVDFVNDLRSVANNLGKTSLKMRDYSKQNGAQYNAKSLTARFGSWDAALKNAGLEGEKSLKGMEYGEKEIKDDVLIADLVRVANELNNPNISTRDYFEHGKYTSQTMSVRFGSWNKAKQKANLEITCVMNTTTEELFQNILELWTLHNPLE